jgi:hypothetical protein
MKLKALLFMAIFILSKDTFGFGQTLGDLTYEYDYNKAWVESFNGAMKEMTLEEKQTYPANELIAACVATEVVKRVRFVCKIGKITTISEVQSCLSGTNIKELMKKADSCYRATGLKPQN